MAQPQPWPPELRRLAELVERVSGNVVPEGFFPFLAEVARERQLANRLPDLASYLRDLAAGRLPNEWQKLLPAITVKESSLFRTPQHFATLSNQLIPELVRARSATRTLRLWSAGCARGEEPTTLSMVLAEHELLAGWSWSILATDVDEEALAQARLGLFSERAMAAVPEELKARYFFRKGDLWAASSQLTSRIAYKTLNLVAEPFPAFPQPFDVIFLRNVLIYFRISSQQRVLERMADVLADDGYLFLGPAETVWQVSDRFEPVDFGTCFVYRKRTAPRPLPRPTRQPSITPSLKLTLTEPQTYRPPAVAPPPEAKATDPLEEVVKLVVSGSLARAQAKLKEVLAANPADPQAHALEGYILEVMGDSQAAICGFRAALYLEPALFQVRLLLAHTLRRIGAAARAKAEYRQVLGTLAGGQAKELDRLGDLPLPTRVQAERQARTALEVLTSNRL
ncbi:MAG: CheR family methyltransferase [Thermoanaerobaculaceae bacterium]